VCDLETLKMRRPWPALGRSVTGKKGKNIYILIYLFLFNLTIFIVAPCISWSHLISTPTNAHT